MKKVHVLFLLLSVTFAKVIGQNNAQFISQSVPTTVDSNEVFNISVTFKNTGTTTWTSTNLYRLGPTGPQDDTTWEVGTRVALPNDVSPGSQVTFQIQVTAPSSGDGYGTNIQWQMLQENVAWFGETLTKSIMVTEDAPMSIDELSRDNAFKIYPNPANPQSEIQIKGHFKKKDRIVLFTISGSKIIEQVIKEDRQNTRLDLQYTPITEEVYILQIIGDSYTQTRKLILQK